MHSDEFTKGPRGEFRGDFTRDTFDPLRHNSRVLMQQGRVQLDADWNEQVSIFSHYMRTAVADLFGPHGVPAKADDKNRKRLEGDGFRIEAVGNTFRIFPGHYYVNGILCENDSNVEKLLYTAQPDYPLIEKEETLATGGHLVYLDVWERHLSYVEDDYMREKALGGPDTASRAKIVWQVKVLNHNQLQTNVSDTVDVNQFKANYELFLQALTNSGSMRPGSGLLKARARKTAADNNVPCLTAPEASYRGVENQLYRVEIHISSVAGAQTFKWSRENGSVIFPIIKVSEKIITLENLGRDNRCGLKSNDWVEIVDDDYILRGQINPLLKISAVDPENLQVTLQEPPASTVGTDPAKHPYLRRWDQKSGDSNGVPVTEGNQDQHWIALEDGVEVQFQSPTSNNGVVTHVYHAGDYWLIPARTATGDVEWPGTEDMPIALPPQGVEHHYAPLCNITVTSDGVKDPIDLRRKWKANWS